MVASTHCTGQVPRRRGISRVTKSYRRRVNGMLPDVPFCRAHCAGPDAATYGDDQVKRRKFITLLGGAAAWPLAVPAQQPTRAHLGYLAPPPEPHLIQALRGGLRDLGYVEGQNLAIEYRFAQGQSKTYDELAAELVRLAPDAIVVVGTPPALAAKRQTTTIPIILAPAADPLRSGLVASLSRPGGNVTGVSLYGSEIARKRMEIFKEAVVGIQRVAVLGNAENPLHRFLWDDLQPIGPALGLQFRLFVVSGLDKFPAVFSAMKQAGFERLAGVQG